MRTAPDSSFNPLQSMLLRTVVCVSVSWVAMSCGTDSNTTSVNENADVQGNNNQRSSSRRGSDVNVRIDEGRGDALANVEEPDANQGRGPQQDVGTAEEPSSDADAHLAEPRDGALGPQEGDLMAWQGDGEIEVVDGPQPDASPSDDDSSQGPIDSDVFDGDSWLGSDAVMDSADGGVTESCGNPCVWEGQECTTATAMLEIVPLDIWAQPLKTPQVSLMSSWGDGPALTGDVVLETPLCEAGDLSIGISQTHHRELQGILWYDGSASETGLYLEMTGEHVSRILSSEMRDVAGENIRYYTLWVGLPHRWFAASGPPARHGNHIELLMNGEEAWATFMTDLEWAEEEALFSTWWWESDFELYRDPATHMYLGDSERWANTVMGIMESIATLGVEQKVLVNQFFSQDGILADYNVDESIISASETPGDGIEYMGHLNPSQGNFDAPLYEVDFFDRVQTQWNVSDNASILESEGLPPVYWACGQADPCKGCFGDPDMAKCQAECACMQDSDCAVGYCVAGTCNCPEQVDMTAYPFEWISSVLVWGNVTHATWHQKFSCIDHDIAYVGGMNVKGVDWDTTDMAIYEERRMHFEATSAEREQVKSKSVFPGDNVFDDLRSEPRKDYMLRIEGPSAYDVRETFRRRWQHQLNENVLYADLSTAMPPSLMPEEKADGLQIQVMATLPPCSDNIPEACDYEGAPFDENSIMEGLVNAISNATTYVLIEDQYIRSPILADALMDRMAEASDLKVIVITRIASEWGDPACWPMYIEVNAFQAAYPDRFRIYRTWSFDYMISFDTGFWSSDYLATAVFEEIGLHSKLVLIDDIYLQVGSSNHNNRGLLYEGELATAVVDETFVKDVRHRVAASFLGAYYQDNTKAKHLFGDFDQVAEDNWWVINTWHLNDSFFDGDLGTADMEPNFVFEYELWADEYEIFDSDLPLYLKPTGVLYPYDIGSPNDCFYEGIGEDVVQASVGADKPII
jgi:phosphatidylserine/phosphatidylglycerophosphate/cardiolipin synthase-like enzyme